MHLAGGKRIERGRLLDDHRHAVPDAVFALLAYVRNDDALIVIERDGAYPPIEELLAELDRARGVAPLAISASARVPHVRRGTEPFDTTTIPRLARLYVDGEERARYLANPDLDLDRHDLILAARSFETKRGRQRGLAARH